ncbi:tyrosine-type recombinase/integrase [Sphingomonas abietis]|uniref:Integrase arm-type DNA-binding domain-containing protein n=1 Tax=Sphingomonas abietis TaxID=3012344 RepID=A0ABY7NL59_9SPHN|nr:integrase arm-type DNA-binding domain-containing protein [Sphingomonas abietis]WBO22287.1 integrase arm-type DNA-binding domain-containing protein [Sphingomonas abietis]
MLNDAKIKAAKKTGKPYKLGDGEQLYLQVTAEGARHWRMNYTYGKNPKGKPAQKTLSFGSYPSITLLMARAKRDEAKALLRDGRDPSVERRVANRAQAAANGNTFETVARRWHTLKTPGWNAVHAADVIASLERDVFPEVGDLPITVLKAPKMLEVLQKVEARGAIETAHRIRQRVSAVFVYGIAAGLCDADPAASLGKALKEVPKAKKQPSIVDGARDQVGRLTAIRQLLIDCEAERCRAATKLALRLLALTAVRPGELAGARWAEFSGLDGPAPLWTIPAERMKGDKDRKSEEYGEHLVPLSRQAVDVLRVLRPLTGHLALCFPGERHVHRTISDATLNQLLRRAGYYQRHVPHGFRAAFSTYMNDRPKGERHEGDRAVIDLMLAHVPKDKVEGAYNRAGYMDRRRELAQEWADLLLDGFWPPEVHSDQPIRWAATGSGRP